MNSRYKEYKKSQISWVENIPSHWTEKRIKYLFNEKASTQNLELNSGSISFGKVVLKDDLSIPESTKLSYQEVLKGEFLINPLNLNYDLKSLRTALSDKNVVVSQGYIVLRLIEKEADPSYFSHLLRVFDVEHMKSLGSGVRQTISFKHLGAEALTLPPIKEQRQIATFLDIKTENIDVLIKLSEKKLRLLNEQRSALVHRVVTKGLDLNTKTKESGVAWIGDIPSHWDIVKLKYVCSVSTGRKDTQDKIEDGCYPFYVRSQKVERINSFSFDGEAVLTAGDGAGVGKVFHYINGKFEYHQRVYKFSDFKRLSGKFFYWFIKNNFINVTEDQNSKSTVDSLRMPLINDFPFVHPPMVEQREIIEYLEHHTNLIEKEISLTKKRIELLTEYRQSLISSVVTGKIKVIEN